MASNPNPFNVASLNGVTFGPGTIYTPAEPQPGVSPIGTDSFESYIEVLGGASYTGGVDPAGPGQITVTSSAYTPGSGTGNDYVLPTFGTIQFSGIQNTDIFGNPEGPRTFYIKGFTEDGFLISTSANITFGTASAFYDQLALVSNVGFGNDGLQFPIAFDSDPSVYTAPCFAAGTRIETPEGPVAVEDLSVGDLVVTAAGCHRRIVWIGRKLARPQRHPRRWEVDPVRVTPHAFAPDVPSREVRLSPGHAVLVDGVLVPVGLLVNGATIVQDAVDEVRYFHIELETHDAVLSEGLACETYLDDGNRRHFANSGEIAELHGRLDPRSWDQACAPLVAAGPQLTELQQRLHDRAQTLGWMRSEEPALRLVAEGAELEPLHRAGNRFWFMAPAGDRWQLRSAAGVLAHVMPGLADGRRLGVAVAALRVDGAAIDHDDAGFGAGFYPTERHEGHAWRWTDGAATLALALAAPAMIEITLAMVAPTWQRAPEALRVVA